MRRLELVTTAVVVVQLVGAGPARAQAHSAAPHPSAFETLRGISRIAIEIRLPSSRAFPNAGTVRSEIAATLQAHGVRVLPDGAYPRLILRSVTRAGEFVAQTNTDVDVTPFTAFGLSLELMQEVRMEGSQRTVPATTWSTLGVGYRDADGVIRELLQDFMGAYVSANERAVTAASAGAAAGAVAPPNVRRTAAGFSIQYGEVPENFLPSIPADAGSSTEILMKKRQPFSLVGISITRYGGLMTDRILQERGIRSHDGRVRALQDPVLSDDLEAVRRSPDNFVLVCGYGDARFFFWYKARPAAADPARLRSRRPDHLLLDMGRPVENCPLTTDLARAAHRNPG